MINEKIKTNSIISFKKDCLSSIQQKDHYFNHAIPTYGYPFDMMGKFEIPYTSTGKNIAQGQYTPEKVVQAWMDSPDHRATILNNSYTHIGVGYVENGNSFFYIICIFLSFILYNSKLYRMTSIRHTKFSAPLLCQFNLFLYIPPLFYCFTWWENTHFCICISCPIYFLTFA